MNPQRSASPDQSCVFEQMKSEVIDLIHVHLFKTDAAARRVKRAPGLVAALSHIE